MAPEGGIAFLDWALDRLPQGWRPTADYVVATVIIGAVIAILIGWARRANAGLGDRATAPPAGAPGPDQGLSSQAASDFAGLGFMFLLVAAVGSVSAGVVMGWINTVLGWVGLSGFPSGLILGVMYGGALICGFIGAGAFAAMAAQRRATALIFTLGGAIGAAAGVAAVVSTAVGWYLLLGNEPGRAKVLDYLLQGAVFAIAALIAAVSFGWLVGRSTWSLRATGIAALGLIGASAFWVHAEVAGLRPALMHTLRGHDGGIGGIAFSPDGAFIASAGFDGTVRAWDAQTGALRWTHRDAPAGRGLPLNGVGVTPDGASVTYLARDGVVFLDAKTGAQQRRATPPAVPARPPAPAAPAPNSSGQTPQPPPAAPVRDRWTLYADDIEWSRNFSLGRSGNTVALIPSGLLGSTTGLVVADANTWRIRARISPKRKDDPTKNDSVGAYSFSAEGLSIIVCTYHGRVQMYDAQNGGAARLDYEIAPQVEGRPPPCAATLAPNNIRIAASYGGAIKIWDGASAESEGKPTRDLSLEKYAPNRPVREVVLSLAYVGQLLIAGYNNGALGVWRDQQGHLVGAARAHEGAVWHIAVAGDGVFASGGRDGVIRLWRIGDRNPLRLLEE